MNGLESRYTPTYHDDALDPSLYSW